MSSRWRRRGRSGGGRFSNFGLRKEKKKRGLPRGVPRGRGKQTDAPSVPAGLQQGKRSVFSAPSRLPEGRWEGRLDRWKVACRAGVVRVTSLYPATKRKEEYLDRSTPGKTRSRPYWTREKVGPPFDRGARKKWKTWEWGGGGGEGGPSLLMSHEMREGVAGDFIFCSKGGKRTPRWHP